jgi:hypothetical protein
VAETFDYGQIGRKLGDLVVDAVEWFVNDS